MNPETIEGTATDDDAPATAPLPVPQASTALVARQELTVDDLVAQVELVNQAMQRVMKDGVHYGVIPGTQKPTLLQPGAQTLLVLFRLAPTFTHRRTWHEGGHLTVESKCVLRHIPTGLVVGEGDGICSSLESRYRYRQAKRRCPACGAETIIKGKAEYGGGWLCWKKEGGCGAKYHDGEEVIESQEVGKVENADPADLWNTIAKMADKRALVAGTLNATAASDTFTQDMEDVAEPEAPPAEQPPARQERAAAAKDDWPRTQKGILDRFEQAWPDVPWTEWLGEYMSLGYAGRKSTELTKDEAAKVVSDLARVYGAVSQVALPGQFPPPGDDELKAAFFDVTKLALDGPRRSDPADDVPFDGAPPA